MGDCVETFLRSGCSSFGIYWRIVLPQFKPARGVQAIFSFLGNRNTFFLSLIYLNSIEKGPLGTWLDAA